MDLLLAAGRARDTSLADAVRRRLEQRFIPWAEGAAAIQAPLLPPPCAAIGIELLPFQLEGVLVNDQGERLACQLVELEDMNVETVVSGAASLTTTLVKSVPAAASERVTLGFQLGGPVDAETGTVLFYRKAPPKAPSPVRNVYWPNHQPLGRLLEKFTGLPAVVHNDADAFATYQRWFGVGRYVSRFAVVLVREGVGGSLVIGNRLFDGPMELGNLSVLPDKVKRACDCGSEGCLETTGGIYGILEGVFDYTGECPNDLEAAAELVESLDVNCAEEPFRLAGEANAKGIGIIVNFARPECVVLYAPPLITEPGYAAAVVFRDAVEDFRSYCHNAAFGDCKLVIEPLRPYVGAHGAALLALERSFGVTADIG
jgi:predicted NBD/HSP70 family sugar kinase